MSTSQYLECVCRIVLRLQALRRRGLEDGVRYANLQQELQELGRRFTDESP